MRLYTRSGDDGTTGLFGGDRVSKDHPRVIAYGTADETNAAIGIAVAHAVGDDPAIGRIREILTELQSRLFDVGADLATPPDSPHADKVRRIAEDDVKRLEDWIDEIDDANEPLRTFVLPGGTKLAAHLHLARTISRRAERTIITARESVGISDALVHFMNRTSDLLFAMARRANGAAGIDDVPWQSGS